jgi:predicted small lipoprotein YifL
MKQSIWILAPMVLVSALCGCGQKGPLYLPERNEVVITAPVGTGTEARPEPLPQNSPPASPSTSPPRAQKPDSSSSSSSSSS